MLTNPNTKQHANDDFETPVEVARNKDGSIDYAFYDHRARTGRGVCFRAAARSLISFIVAILGSNSDDFVKDRKSGIFTGSDTFLSPANTADPKAA